MIDLLLVPGYLLPELPLHHLQHFFLVLLSLLKKLLFHEPIKQRLLSLRQRMILELDLALRECSGLEKQGVLFLVLIDFLDIEGMSLVQLLQLLFELKVVKTLASFPLSLIFFIGVSVCFWEGKLF